MDLFNQIERILHYEILATSLDDLTAYFDDPKLSPAEGVRAALWICKIGYYDCSQVAVYMPTESYPISPKRTLFSLPAGLCPR